MTENKNKSENIAKKITLYKLNQDVDSQTISFPGFVQVAHFDNTEFYSELYFKTQKDNDAPWYTLFKGKGVDLSEFGGIPPQVKSSGFVYLIKVGNNIYACTGGTGFHAITAQKYHEPRFGITLAKKILGSLHLRGLNQKETHGILNSIDRIFKGNYRPKGDIDNLHRIITHIRAIPANSEKTIKHKYKGKDIEIGRSIIAGDSLQITGKKSLDEVHQFIYDIDNIWNTGKTSDDLPELDFIDPKTRMRLVNSLVQALHNMVKSGSRLGELYLDDMETGFLSDQVEEFRINDGPWKESASDPDEVMTKVSDYLSLNQNAKLGEIQVVCKYSDDRPSTPRKLLSEYICGDVTYQNETYFVIGNRWYQANRAFIQLIDKEINGIKCYSPTEIGMPSWTTACKTEDDYISSCATKFTILHKHFVRSVGGFDTIEFCDLLGEKVNKQLLIHIKHDSGASLRELFSQGLLSIQEYHHHSEFRDKVHNSDLDGKADLSAKDKHQLKDLKSAMREEICIVFAIYDEKHSIPANADTTLKNFSGTLTLFAKIDLIGRVQAIRSMGYSVALTRIRS